MTDAPAFDASTIATQFAAVREGVARAVRDAGHPPEAVTLVAVSKLFPANAIRPVLEAGHRVFGENYVQEAMAKWPDLRADYPGVALHLIGPLQSNKAKEAVATFDVIETLDRESLARALAKEIQKAGRSPGLLVQINTGAEPQKGGVLPEEADAFVKLCRESYGLPVFGLMCIPPFDQPPSAHFALLGKIAARNGLTTLSMGMSADFEQAIMLGATHVRVGTAIFGARQTAGKG
ncbi:MAG: YggS family pyridoxal phosphate-dependent enzyme [Beijerinckiaceae bacterium]